jgi:hypothetical protein
MTQNASQRQSLLNDTKYMIMKFTVILIISKGHIGIKMHYNDMKQIIITLKVS